MSQLHKEDFSGKLIRCLRQLKGLKQKEAGKRMGISQQSYSKIELRENIKRPLICIILNAFNSNLEELSQIKDMLA